MEVLLCIFIYVFGVGRDVRAAEKAPAINLDGCQHLSPRLDDVHGTACSMCGAIIDPTPVFDTMYQSAFGIAKRSALNNTPTGKILGSVLDFRFSRDKFRRLDGDGNIGGGIIEQRHIIRNRRDKAHSQWVWQHDMTMLCEHALSSSHLDVRLKDDVMNLLKQYEARKEHYFVARKEVMIASLIYLLYQSRKLHVYPAVFYPFLIPGYHDINNEILAYKGRPHHHESNTRHRRDCSLCTVIAKLKREKAQRQNKIRRELFATIRRMKRVLGIKFSAVVDYDAQLRYFFSLLRLPVNNRVALTSLWERLSEKRLASGEFPDGLREADVISALCLIVLTHQRGEDGEVRKRVREFEELSGLSSNVSNKIVKRVEEMIGPTMLAQAFA